MCSAHEGVEDATLLRFTNGGKHSKESAVLCADMIPVSTLIHFWPAWARVAKEN
jgi:hypothetical protein